MGAKRTRTEADHKHFSLYEVKENGDQSSSVRSAVSAGRMPICELSVLAHGEDGRRVRHDLRPQPRREHRGGERPWRLLASRSAT